MNNSVRATLTRAGIIPVIKLSSADRAVPLAQTLARAGLPVAEITFRSAAAPEAIRRIASEAPEVLVGAGTVVSPDQVRAAQQAGARFIVTPGFNPRVVEAARAAGLLVVPGVNNPTGVEQGMEAGLSLLKFFPAAASGGPAMLRALAGPYPEMEFVPTGGVSADNLATYLACTNVAAVGGSWIVPSAAVEAGDMQTVETLTRAALEEAQRVRGARS